MLTPIGCDITGGVVGYGLSGSQDGSAVGVVPPERILVRIIEHGFWVVGVACDLLQDDRLFGVEGLGCGVAMSDQVGDHLKRGPPVCRQDRGMKRGLVVCCPCVEVTTE